MKEWLSTCKGWEDSEYNNWLKEDPNNYHNKHEQQLKKLILLRKISWLVSQSNISLLTHLKLMLAE